MGSILYTIANWRKLVLSLSLTVLLKIYLYYISAFRKQTLETYKYPIRQTKIFKAQAFLCLILRAKGRNLNRL